MSAEAFEHVGLLYRGTADYVAAVTTTARQALETGGQVLIAVPPSKLHTVRGALADVAEMISFADMTVAGRNPGRILPSVLLAFAGRGEGRRVTVVGEPVWAGRSEIEQDACAVHEALINAVFAGRDAMILCPYDVTRLRPAVITRAWRTHPVMLDGGVVRRSAAYADPLETAADLDRPLPPVPAYALKRVFGDRPGLSQARAFVRRHAAATLSPERLDDLVMAANELMTNSLRHTPGGGHIALWNQPGLLVCQVDDAGPWPGPLAGRVPPEREGGSGRGLILVNELCDLVRVHRHAEGTSVRVHLAS